MAGVYKWLLLGAMLCDSFLHPLFHLCLYPRYPIRRKLDTLGEAPYLLFTGDVLN
jgi:hypothetical protein